MKSLFNIFSFLLILSMGAACDVIEPDDRLKNEFGFGELPDSTNRVVLMEEFTGSKCLNCPIAAEELRRIEDLFPGRVISIAIHSGNFAVPDSKHPQDFRTSEGGDLDNFFDPIGYPAGMFDRAGYPAGKVNNIAISSWEDTVKSRLEKPTFLELVTSLSLSLDSTELEFELAARPVKDTANVDLFSIVYLTESGIVAPQTKPSGKVDTAYVHNHVLRASFGGQAFGAPFVGGGLTKDQIERESYSLTIDPKWVLSNVSAIVIIYDRATYEIVQVGHAIL